MNETLVYLPFETTVLAQVFVGANYTQKVVLTPAGRQPLPPIEGSGGENKEIGRHKIVTGPEEAGKQGFLVTATIEYNDSSGWKASKVVLSRPCSAATFTAQFIASEDHYDYDWNDCLVMFTWTSRVAAAADAEETEASGD